jgi:hypothetical protein
MIHSGFWDIGTASGVMAQQDVTQTAAASKPSLLLWWYNCSGN